MISKTEEILQKCLANQTLNQRLFLISLFMNVSYVVLDGAGEIVLGRQSDKTWRCMKDEDLQEFVAWIESGAAGCCEPDWDDAAVFTAVSRYVWMHWEDI